MAAHPDQPDYSVPSLGPISKESRLEWRSLLWNDGDIEDGETPDNFLTGTWAKGKFFPRGCRGKIERLEIYCRAAAGGTLDLSISPHPGMGQTYTETITPGVAWAWQSVDLRQFWNYDSLFIWVSRCDFDVSYAYDEVAPYDAHHSLVVPPPWFRQNRRYFIRAVYDAETAGDVPVSGTVNNIEIPSKSTNTTGATKYIAGAGAEDTLLDIAGAGQVEWIYIIARRSAGDPAPDKLNIKITIDGAEWSISINDLFGMVNSVIGTPTPVIFTLIDNTVSDQKHGFWLWYPQQFRRRFTVVLENTNLAADITMVHADACYRLIR